MKPRTAEERSVIERLRSWHWRLDQAITLFGNPDTPGDRQRVRESYREIKQDLRKENAALERRERYGRLTAIEASSYRHVVSDALVHLWVATNSSVGHAMFGALTDAAADFSHALAGFDELQEGDDAPEK